MIALEIHLILGVWFGMGEQVGDGGKDKADFRSCRTFPRRHQAARGNAEMLLPRWSGKSLQRETRAANAEESQELEADQRPGLGKGLPQVAGAGRASTSQRHH